MSSTYSSNFFSLSKETTIRDYLELFKPGVMSLVVYTGIIAMLVAPGHIHPVIALMAIICLALGSGAAGAINMWYDRDIDAIMARTQNRPIPSGRIDPQSVLHFGVGLSVAAVLMMGLFVNMLSAFILAFAIFFYVCVYTMWLKRNTPQNIVIGGAAGAFPPLIGWTAVMNSISIEPIIMFLIIFLWTPPHFWALALAKADDYKKANIPMMPVVRGEKSTKYQILFYTGLLFLLTLGVYFFSDWSFIYLLGALILSTTFLYLAFCVFKSTDKKIYIKTFLFSIFYLFALFGVILVSNLVLF